jgi:hypothetical protein
MKFSIALVPLLLNINSSSAFSPSFQRGVLTRRSQVAQTRIFSQWDDEEDEVAVEVVADDRRSFADAGLALNDEDDQKKMDEQGDFDANPAVSFYRIFF